MEDGARSQGMQTASRHYNRQRNDNLLETLGKKTALLTHFKTSDI